MSGRKKPYVPKPKIYVQLRAYEAGKGIRHIPGKTIIFEGATAEQVHALIVGAAKEAQERARKARLENAKAEKAAKAAERERAAAGGAGDGDGDRNG